MWSHWPQIKHITCRDVSQGEDDADVGEWQCGWDWLHGYCSLCNGAPTPYHHHRCWWHRLHTRPWPWVPLWRRQDTVPHFHAIREGRRAGESYYSNQWPTWLSGISCHAYRLILTFHPYPSTPISLATLVTQHIYNGLVPLPPWICPWVEFRSRGYQLNPVFGKIPISERRKKQAVNVSKRRSSEL